MKDFDKIIEQLVKTEELCGIFGVFGLILTVVLFLGLWAFYKAFFEKKAESIFEKALTKYKGDLVSEIGQNFLNQTEEIQKNITELKSELNLLSGQRSSFLNERRKCLLNLYTAHVDWVNTIIDKSVSVIIDENSHLQEGYQAEFRHLNHKVNIASAAYQVFGRDEVLNTLFPQLLVDTTKLQNLKNSQLLMYTRFRSRISLLNRQRDEAKLKEEKLVNFDLELEMCAKQNINFIENSEKKILSTYEEIILKQNKAAARISKIIKESFES